ncbi:MAG: undecaprenyl-diphosphate phosphatase [Bernardetiaceae bacterium]|nr:undecaprenyl-diphosphate phosphatase [Bernardetiaceae bacterium]
MGIIEALILGIVQGLTEFLPVSSSGHIELGKAILKVEASDDNLLFSIVVHAATSLSTIIVFRKDIAVILEGLWQRQSFAWDYAFKILVSMIPIFIIGIFFEKQIDAFFSGRVFFVCAMLVLTGILLFLTHFLQAKEKPIMERNLGKVSYKQAIIIGIAQAIAVLPGISRSGSTIATALLTGVRREAAARFSFLMVLIPILGATFLKFLSYMKADAATVDAIELLPLLVGFVAAFISGVIACILMIRIVKQGQLIYFGVYCLAVGIIGMLLVSFAI